MLIAAVVLITFQSRFAKNIKTVFLFSFPSFWMKLYPKLPFQIEEEAHIIPLHKNMTFLWLKTIMRYHFFYFFLQNTREVGK